LVFYPQYFTAGVKNKKRLWDNRFPGRGNTKMTDEQKEIARLKKDLKDAQMERDILKKAIRIFSASDRTNTGS
tara:strand:- start:209 stop:427 length:219 start_codon:yes stop_codon:yes gene_type:complete